MRAEDPSIMASTWQAKLKSSGLYYDGFVSGKELSDLLENHRRDTASTFGTRKSSSPANRTDTASTTAHPGPKTETSNSENLSIQNYSIYYSACMYNYYYARMTQMLTANHQLGSIGNTQLLGPLFTLEVFHFLRVREKFWIVSMEYNITNPRNV